MLLCAMCRASIVRRSTVILPNMASQLVSRLVSHPSNNSSSSEFSLEIPREGHTTRHEQQTRNRCNCLLFSRSMCCICASLYSTICAWCALNVSRQALFTNASLPQRSHPSFVSRSSHSSSRDEMCSSKTNEIVECVSIPLFVVSWN